MKFIISEDMEPKTFLRHFCEFLVLRTVGDPNFQKRRTMLLVSRSQVSKVFIFWMVIQPFTRLYYIYVIIIYIHLEMGFMYISLKDHLFTPLGETR